MTRARVQPTGRLLLGSADAVLRHLVAPPQVDVLPYPPNAAVVNQAVLPQFPVAAAELHQQVKNQAAEVPPLEVTPPLPLRSTQRRNLSAPKSVPARSLLDLLSATSRKRSGLYHPSPAPCPTPPPLKLFIQIP